MPDSTRQTVSATEVSALFGASPYVTKWLLFQKFARGVNIDSEADTLMREGTLLQPYLLERCAEELGLIVTPEHAYVRRGRLGCTRDATVICPDRGPGALEIKCVFNSQVWMRDWDGGKIVPRHIEIQLAQQLHVGGGSGTLSRVNPFTWGIVCAYFAGQRHFFERKYLPDFGAKLEAVADQFFDDIENDREPDPFGVPIEIPWLTELFPVNEKKTLDLHESEELTDIARRLESSRAAAREQDKYRAVLLGVAKDASKLFLADGVIVNISGGAKGKRISVYDPNGGEA